MRVPRIKLSGGNEALRSPTSTPNWPWLAAEDLDVPNFDTSLLQHLPPDSLLDRFPLRRSPLSDQKGDTVLPSRIIRGH